MLNTIRATRGITVAPHALASQAGRDVLSEGGNALEAAIAMAATLSVVYPHMTGLGGDSFWLVYAPGSEPMGIDASGRTPTTLTPEFYRDQGLKAVPHRGPSSANTVAGTVSGWAAALNVSRNQWGGRLPLERLLADAVSRAEDGYPVTASQARCTLAQLGNLANQPGFSEVFLDEGRPPGPGSLQRQPRLAATLRQLAQAGLRDFYSGAVSEGLAADLQAAGSPVTHADLLAHRPIAATPLNLPNSLGTLYNMPPPTQGMASLIMLGLFERKYTEALECDSGEYIHLIAEATKAAFRLRDRHVHDPRDMRVPAEQLIDPDHLDKLAKTLNMDRASPWEGVGDRGDTTWFGAIDSEGRAVSVIQSIYHEFGSGLVLPGSGICWQNRGSSFSLDPASPNLLRPGRQPFHTLNPALALFDDGRVLIYGTMGGDGQPQTQAAVYTRYAYYGRELQAAVSAPRWLLGRTWGDDSNTLKLESRFPVEVLVDLERRGHPVEVVGEFDELMGHAGALALRPDGVMEGAADPRSDGAVAPL